MGGVQGWLCRAHGCGHELFKGFARTQLCYLISTSLTPDAHLCLLLAALHAGGAWGRHGPCRRRWRLLAAATATPALLALLAASSAFRAGDNAFMLVVARPSLLNRL